jgi:hypothetical protein
MKILFSAISNSTKIFALSAVVLLSSCGGAVSNEDVEKAKESVNAQNPSSDPSAEKGTDVSVNPTNTNADPASNKNNPATGTTKIAFNEEKFDFGNVKEGDKVTHMFKFKNIGDKPLIITDAKGSCGCTVPEYPRNPIAPGESGEIKVEFNSKDKPGKQTKFVTLNANTEPSEMRLTINANVIGKDVKTK